MNRKNHFYSFKLQCPVNEYYCLMNEIYDTSERVSVHVRVQGDSGTEQVRTNIITSYVACGKNPQAQDLAGKGEC